jgi:RNA polymerase sigma-70 factor, ECF subfamily
LQERPSPDERSDCQLLRLGAMGDEEAFLSLYGRRRESVFRFSFHMSGSREIAEEVTQEVFLALLANHSIYKEERGTLEGFLIGMARNQVRGQLRSLSRLDPVSSAAMLQFSVEESGLDDELRALRQAILTLPENYRAVIALCELDEVSYAEAAKRLGCAVGTVRSRLHRARAILEEKLRRRRLCPTATAR